MRSFQARMALLVGVLCLGLWSAAPGTAKTYTPPRGKVFAGVTGGTSIVPFEKLVGRHPPVFERFMRWNANTDWLAIKHSTFRTRLGVALTTAVAKYRRAVISSREIAHGRGDRFLLAMNRNMASSGRIFYVRIMPEMNGWWNPYCAFNKNGSFRGKAFSPHFFIEAWRRIVLILRGGAVRKIDHRLHALGLPPIRGRISTRAVLPHPKVAILWVPMTRGDPEFARNAPGVYWPGRAYVDWVGTDEFSPWVRFKWLNRFYDRFRGKPFVLAEWGVEGRDDPNFVRDVFAWVRRHARLRMLNYYQGYTPADPYNPIHYPKSMAVLHRELLSSKFPQYAPEYQKRVPTWIGDT